MWYEECSWQSVLPQLRQWCCESVKSVRDQPKLKESLQGREGGGRGREEAYAAAESGEGASADVAVGRLLERRRRLHNLRRRRLAANLMLRRSGTPI